MSGQGRGGQVGALVGVLALVGALAGCDALAEELGEAYPSAKPVPCPESGVRLLEGEVNAAMGLRVADVQLLNCGAKVYELEGHPQVRLLDRERRPLEVSVAPGNNGVTGAGAGPATGTSEDAGDGVPPQKVVLQPGQAASTGLVWRNLVTDGTTRATEGWVLEVVPKPGAPRLTLELKYPVDLGNTGRVGVSPWRTLSG